MLLGANTGIIPVLPTISNTTTLSIVSVDSEELVELLVHLTLRIREHERQCLDRFRISHQQARALWALKPGESMSVRALAGRIAADPSNLSTALGELEERGLIERVPAPHDRRVRPLSLTDDGATERRRLVECLVPPPVAALAPDERQRLAELLRALDRAG